MCIKIFLGKVDLFGPLLGDIEAIILCSFDFDLKKKIKKKNPPARPFSKKKLWRTTKQLFLLGLTVLIKTCSANEGCVVQCF